MSKKTTPGSTTSASPPKTTMNSNSYGPAFRWQSGAFLPPSIGQLALPPPTSVPASLWTPIGAPITQGYGFGMPYGHQMRTSFGPPPGVGSHPNYCCLAGQRHQCQSFDHNCNGWPNSSSNVCWHHNQRDFENQTNATSNGVLAISEVDKDDSDDVSTDGTDNDNSGETKSRKTAKNLRSKSNSEDKNEVKKVKEKFLNMKEKIAIEYIEKFQLNLKKYGDFIRQEANRFYSNDSMSKKLQPIVEQLTSASAQAKEEKEKIRQSVATARQQIKVNKDFDLDNFTLDSISLPDLPDLLTFYKSILDGIPTVFLSDLSQLKRMANDLIQNKIPVSSGLSIGLSFGGESSSPLKAVHPLPSASNSMFAVPPKISELPKPDFNTLPLKPSSEAIPIKEPPPALDLNFPRSLSPIPLPHSIIEDSTPSPPLLDIITPAQMKERSISPIGKPVQQLPMIDLKDIFAASSLRNGQNNTLSAIGESLRPKAETKLETDSIRAPLNPIPSFMKSPIKPVAEAKSPPPQVTSPPPADSPPVTLPPASAFMPSVIPVAKPVLNQAQSKLLIKLKEKYPTLSDEQLTDSMSKTKAQIVALGNPKGFTGMKVADIIAKISDYIDKNVSNRAFTKPRLVELRSGSFENNYVTIGGDGNKPMAHPVGTKTWKTAIQQTHTKIDVSTCSICFEPISTSSKYETECHHFFHNSCISNWIRTEGSCPICRCHVLPPEEFPHLS